MLRAWSGSLWPAVAARWANNPGARPARLRYLSRPTLRREPQPMAQYKLHCFAQSGNSYKAALYLTCAGLDWEPVFVDFFNGQTRDPKWRAEVNEMGEVPVFEDGATKLTQTG